ncbi:MAG: hypothetical protein R3F19_17505 [Verrucomicrobiales bacterium]
MIRISDLLEYSVGWISRVTFDVHLSRQNALVALADGKVNVWRPAWVGGWFNGAKIVAALPVGEESPVALKVFVLLVLVLVGAACVEVNTIAVTLPDLDQRVGNRPALMSKTCPKGA